MITFQAISERCPWRGGTMCHAIQQSCNKGNCAIYRAISTVDASKDT